MTSRRGHTVLTAALASGRLEMAKEVLGRFQNIPDAQVNESARKGPSPLAVKREFFPATAGKLHFVDLNR